MSPLRIRHVKQLDGFCLELTLTNGSIVHRDVAALLQGPIFEPLRADPALFKQARVEAGTVSWPNGADMCSGVLIWGGPPPAEANAIPPARITAA